MKEIEFEEGELVRLGYNLTFDVYGVPLNGEGRIFTVNDVQFLENKIVLYLKKIEKRSMDSYHLVLYENKKYQIVDNSYAVDYNEYRNIQKIETKEK